MVTCLTTEISNEEKIGLGALSYEVMPRIGEFVSITTENRERGVYEVAMVIHAPSQEGGTPDGADVYLKYIGEEIDVFLQLSR